MALVNTAAELTKRGRRVLIMDFDLEAPGISTYHPFVGSSDRRGVVDYVAEFAQNLRAPKASEFIVECDLSIGGETLPIWAFPAGRRDDTYGTKLASIDWQDLYVNLSGYLLFEDLRQQLKNDPRKFDYVLIDSRTGHTDVGGICTRQLADVVVLMFFPNQQNIAGLSTIANEIRAGSENRSRKIELLFVPSNVPDLDDEDGILKRMMELAGERLGYEDPAVVIHHYDSLSLVEQDIFTVCRPKSRLAEEYRKLTTSIVQLNMEDREGALSALHQVRAYLEFAGRRGARLSDGEEWITKTINSLDSIGRIHSTDGEVAWTLATVYQSLGNLSNELNALNDALKAGYNLDGIRLRRALNLMSQSRPTEAKIDLLAVISSAGAGTIVLRSAIEALRTIEPFWYIPLASSPALSSLEPDELQMLSDVLMTDADGLRIAHHTLKKALKKKSPENVRRDVQIQFSLVLIGLGKFLEAMQFISIDRYALMRSDDIHSIFNYAMAEWGHSRTPPYDMIELVVSFDRKESKPGANYLQCLSVCYAMVEEYETARRYLERAKKSLGPGKIFSSWRYRFVDRDVMVQDLDSIRTAIDDGRIFPLFMRAEADETVLH
jgi:cellulose biosynthesis protein BcsQ